MVFIFKLKILINKKKKKKELSTLNESIAWNVNYINKTVTEKNEKTWPH